MIGHQNISNYFFHQITLQLLQSSLRSYCNLNSCSQPICMIITLYHLLFPLLPCYCLFSSFISFSFSFPNTTSFFSNVVFAACAVVATALAQIFTNTYQKSLDCNAMQLLYHTSPIIALVSEDYSQKNILYYLS